MLNGIYLHGVDEHSSQPERNLLGELLSGHSNFKTVTEIDVKDLSTQTIQHQIGRMAIAETEDVTHH